MTNFNNRTSHEFRDNMEEVVFVPQKTWTPQSVPPEYKSPDSLKELSLSDAILYASYGEPIHFRAPDGRLVHVRDLDNDFDVMTATLSQETIEVWFPGVSRALGEDDPLVPGWIIKQAEDVIESIRNLKRPPPTPAHPQRVPADVGWTTDLPEMSYEEFHENGGKIEFCTALIRMPEGDLKRPEDLSQNKQEYSKMWLRQPRVEAWIPVWQDQKVCMQPHSVLTIDEEQRKTMEAWSNGQ